MSPFQAYVCGKRHHGFGKGSHATRTAPAAEPPPFQGPALPARAARGVFFLKFYKKIFRRDRRFCSISPFFCAIVEHSVAPRPVKNAARGIGAPRTRAQIFPCTTAPPGRARAEKPGLPPQCAAVIKRPLRRGKRRSEKGTEGGRPRRPPWIFAPEKKASPSRPSGASSPASLPHAFASPFRGRFVRNFFATAFHKKTAGAPLLIGRRRLPFRTQTTKRRMRLSAQARRAAPPEIWRRPAKRPGAFSIPRPAAFPARARAGGNRVPAPRPSQ